MEASCDNLLWQGNVNTISKPNFKIYYGLMRKAAIIASIQQRSWFTKSKIAENVKKDEFIYWQNHYALDDVIEDSQCVEDFSNGSIDITEIWAKESTEENFRASTLTLHQEKIHQDNEYSNKFREHGKSPKPKSSLHKAFHTYEPEVLPHMAIVLPRPRQGRRVSTDLTESGVKNKCQISFKSYSI
nr:uncharacterized protein LOC108084112 isoform X2 [Drosophila kikkawai]